MLVQEAKPPWTRWFSLFLGLLYHGHQQGSMAKSRWMIHFHWYNMMIHNADIHSEHQIWWMSALCTWHTTNPVSMQHWNQNVGCFFHSPLAEFPQFGDLSDALRLICVFLSNPYSSWLSQLRWRTSSIGGLQKLTIDPTQEGLKEVFAVLEFIWS